MLTEIQEHVITGSLLGDGSIWTNFVTPNCKFTKSQSKVDSSGTDKKTYMNWHEHILGKLVSSIKESTFKGPGGKMYNKYTLTTHLDEIWRAIDEKWYTMELQDRRIKRRKIVPKDIKLTPLSLCVWHMDDGYNSQTDGNIELNTQGFTLAEVDHLIKCLKDDLGIIAKSKNAKRKSMKKQEQYKIYVGRKSYFDFIEIIKPHVAWDCFKYKIDTFGYTKKPHRGETHSGAKLTEERVRQIFVLRDKGLPQKEIAKKLEMSKAAISLIISGQHWQHLGMSRPTAKKPRLTKEKKRQIIELNSQGLSQKEIAEQLNINQSTVSRVLKEAQCHA